MKKTAKFYFARNFKQFLKQLKVPAGFTLSTEIKSDPSYGRGRPTKCMYVTLNGPNVEIIMDCRMGNSWQLDRTRKYKGVKIVCVNGHTNYTVNGDSFTYDRLGVSDSFYTEVEYDINQLISQQLEKVKKSIEWHKTAIEIPIIGRLISPESLEEAKRMLASGKMWDSMPGGFGTGYTFTKNRKNHPYCKIAAKELEEFFGVSPLFIIETEMD